MEYRWKACLLQVIQPTRYQEPQMGNPSPRTILGSRNSFYPHSKLLLFGSNKNLLVFNKKLIRKLAYYFLFVFNKCTYLQHLFTSTKDHHSSSISYLLNDMNRMPLPRKKQNNQTQSGHSDQHTEMHTAF